MNKDQSRSDDVIINKKYYYNRDQQQVRIVAVRIDGKLLDDYLSLKQKRMIKKDSVLLRPIMRMGLVGACWLEERGLLTLNDYKLSKILAGLSLDEKADLLELLKQELQV